MPIVQIELVEGRSVDEKRALVDKVTRAVVEAVSCPETAVSIILRDMKRENYGHAGKLWCDR